MGGGLQKPLGLVRIGIGTRHQEPGNHRCLLLMPVTDDSLVPAPLFLVPGPWFLVPVSCCTSLDSHVPRLLEVLLGICPEGCERLSALYA